MGLLTASVAVVPLLAACASDDRATAGLGCPQVGIVRDVASVTTFRPGSGRDPTDVVSRARIHDYGGRCAYEQGGVVVELDLKMAAQPGPAMSGNQATYTYFVAVLDGAQNVLAREQFPVQFEFKGPQPVQMTEPLSPRIPLAAGVDGRGYEILVGWVVDAAQLEWNRTQAPE
ncbi:MAG TPA: hypothetical protein VEY95_00145 [Azospirillaceae bacterium]|nr:hypothetical protein [Azospirillaceae bacterium]